MTPEEWQEMERNDYAPNPTPAWVDYVFAAGLFVAGCALGSLALWGLIAASRALAGML